MKGTAHGLGPLVVALDGWQAELLADCDVAEFFESVSKGYPVGDESAYGLFNVTKVGFRMNMQRHCFSARNLEHNERVIESMPAPIRELAGETLSTSPE